jgi:hypothetical protein
MSRGFQGEFVVYPTPRYIPQALADFADPQDAEVVGGVFRHVTSPLCDWVRRSMGKLLNV